MTVLYLLLTSILSQVLHPFHASVCEIEYNQDGKALQLTYRMFLDDLENALEKKYDVQLDILQPEQKDQVDELVASYLSDHFKFWVNGDKVDIDYLGSEMEGYTLWCFIEITKVRKLKTLEVDNEVMTELFDDQVNLVHFNKEDQVRSLKLQKDHTYGKLELEDLF